MAACRLLALPRELRDEIWELCFTPAEPIELIGCQCGRSIPTSLLRTCHQIQSEATPYLYRRPVWGNDVTALRCMRKIGANAAHFRSLELEIGYFHGRSQSPKWTIAAILDLAPGLTDLIITFYDHEIKKKTDPVVCGPCHCWYGGETTWKCAALHPKGSSSNQGHRDLLPRLRVKINQYMIFNLMSEETWDVPEGEDRGAFFSRHEAWFKTELVGELMEYRVRRAQEMINIMAKKKEHKRKRAEYQNERSEFQERSRAFDTVNRDL